jgi:hypothetical protein
MRKKMENKLFAEVMDELSKLWTNLDDNKKSELINLFVNTSIEVDAEKRQSDAVMEFINNALDECNKQNERKMKSYSELKKESKIVASLEVESTIRRAMAKGELNAIINKKWIDSGLYIELYENGFSISPYVSDHPDCYRICWK